MRLSPAFFKERKYAMETSPEFIRSAMLLGTEAEEILKEAHVTVFGAGGVGGNCIEALSRCGIGNIHITDPDTVSLSNLNRQCAATKEYVGKFKVDSMKARIEAVSNCNVTTSRLFVLPENVETAVPQSTDFIVDAIDTVSAKTALIIYANEHNIPIISCMGMGNRIDPTQIRLGDIFSVNGCPLARTIKKELRKCSIGSLPVVYSLEPPKTPLPLEKDPNPRRQTPGSVSFVPPAAGLAMASFVVKSILNME